MADIIKSEQAQPAKLTKEAQKALREAEVMIAGSIEMRKFAPIAMAAGIEKVRDEKLYLAYGLTSCEEYCEKFSMGRRSMYSYLKVADIARNHIATKTGQDPKDVVLNPGTLKEHFGGVPKKLTLEHIIEAARDINTLENYLAGGEIKTIEIAKILGGNDAKALPEAAEAKTAPRADIFERMRAKGYVWNKGTKQFENPDGTALTMAQIGEVVEESDVTAFFESTRAIIDQVKQQVKARLESYEMILEAFVGVSHNPATLSKFEEEAKSLLKSAEMIKAEIYEGLPEKD